MLVKHATHRVLSATLAGSGGTLSRTATFKEAHRHAFNYTPRPGFLYVRSRAISSRCNDNFDEFPAEEIKKAYSSFKGKPVFVNHVNDNHRRARGVIIDAALHEDSNPDGSPDTWVEVLMEVDAVKFPKLAKAILAGEIDRTSMGTDVAFSKCSFCGNKASTPLEYCQHIPKLKGKRIRRRTASGTQEDVLIREICYGLGFFENSLLVEEPADPTAFFLGVEAGPGLAMAASLNKVEASQWHRFRGQYVLMDGDPYTSIIEASGDAFDWSVFYTASGGSEQPALIEKGTATSLVAAQHEVERILTRPVQKAASLNKVAHTKVKSWMSENVGAHGATVVFVKCSCGDVFFQRSARTEGDRGIKRAWAQAYGELRRHTDDPVNVRSLLPNDVTGSKVAHEWTDEDEREHPRDADGKWVEDGQPDKLPEPGSEAEHEEQHTTDEVAEVADEEGVQPKSEEQKQVDTQEKFDDAEGDDPSEVEIDPEQGYIPKKPPTGSGDSKEDPIVTDDVEAAAEGLSRGKYVRLDQPRMVSTLLEKLAAIADTDPDLAKTINLCNISVKGTNLFCAENIGYERTKMPQLKARKVLPGSKAERELKPNASGEYDLQPMFQDHLRSMGLGIEAGREKAAYLKASQNELQGGKVSQMARKLRDGGNLGDEAIFVSSDNYIVDGHHRWAGNVGADLADGIADNEYDMAIVRIDLDIISLLAEANRFAHEWGIPQAGITASLLRRQAMLCEGTGKAPVDGGCPACKYPISTKDGVVVSHSKLLGDRSKNNQWIGPAGASLQTQAYGDTVAPPKVDTLREENCPVCGERDSYDSDKCLVCGFIKPPDKFMDPDLEVARQTDLRQEGDDQADDDGDADLECDNCGRTFNSGGGDEAAAAGVAPAFIPPGKKQEKTAATPPGNTLQQPKLPKPKQEADDPTNVEQKNDDSGDVETASKAGDTCPECGEGRLQPKTPKAEDPADQDDQPDKNETPKDGEKGQVKPPMKASSLSEPRQLQATYEADKEKSMHEKVIASQQARIAALEDVLYAVAERMGIHSEAAVKEMVNLRATATLLKRADVENPAQPIPDPPSEAPAATTAETLGDLNDEDVEKIGDTAVTDVAADATTSVTSIETVLDAPLDLNEQDPTRPVSGTEEIPPLSDTKTETEVRVGDPNNPAVPFKETGWTNTSSQARTYASLRLARLRIQAGIEASADDLTVAEQIESSASSDQAISAEIETLSKVLTTQASRAPERQPVSRSLVPRAAAREERLVPSMAGGPEPVMQMTAGAVTDDEMLFE